MHTEIEERILEIDKDKIIKKLEELGATKAGEWFYKRYTYDFTPKRENQWLRLRTNGVETTLTYKNVETRELDGTKEFEIEVSDFEETNKMLEVLGYKYKNYQETKRIRYYLNDVEVDIDTWPLIPTYLEIEGKSEEEVYKTLDILGIDRDKATSLDVTGIYNDIYNIDIMKIPNLTFDVDNE